MDFTKGAPKNVNGSAKHPLPANNGLRKFSPAQAVNQAIAGYGKSSTPRPILSGGTYDHPVKVIQR